MRRDFFTPLPKPHSARLLQSFRAWLFRATSRLSRKGLLAVYKVAVRGSWKENTGFQYCESKEQLLRNTRLLKEEVSELIAKKFLFEIVSRQNMCDRKHELYTLKLLCAPGNPLYTTSGLNVNFTVLYAKLIDLSYFK